MIVDTQYILVEMNLLTLESNGAKWNKLMVRLGLVHGNLESQTENVNEGAGYEKLLL